MGTKERKEKERKRRKEQILSAAIGLVKEQGFDKTTMDQIAERAELSKGTLYLYFRDKSALHQSIKKKGLKIIHTEFLNILQEDIPGAEVVRKMALSFTDFILKNATFTRAMVLYEQSRQDKRDDYPIEKDCNHLKNELFMLIIRGLQIGIQDKSIHSNLHPKILGLHIAFELQGILQYSISSQNGHIPALIKEQDMTIHQMVDQFIQVQFKQQAENN
ncbi:MAG: TetR/AcrR family transcriptional regulator [Balneolaceae bacterium]